MMGAADHQQLAKVVRPTLDPQRRVVNIQPQPISTVATRTTFLAFVQSTSPAASAAFSLGNSGMLLPMRSRSRATSASDPVWGATPNRPAPAYTPRMPMPLHVQPEIVTEFPVHVGARVTAEGPYRLRYSLSGGSMPGPYLDTIHAVSTSFAWYDDLTADLISATLQNSLVIRNHLGWRPFAKLGFQFEVGYGWVGLGGGLTGAEVIEAATGKSLNGEFGENLAVDAKATLHMLDATVGWDQRVWRGLHARLDLGAAFTLGSKTVLTPEFDVPRRAEPAVDDLMAEGEAYLDDTFRTYVHTPTVGLGLGWQF